jgi:energy-coupling factor transport system substrate-specific component
MKALGMIEVIGYLAAVEALDSALKAAKVTMVNVTLVRGGLVSVFVTGDVGAVKAAMDASKTAAKRVGEVISVHVIPRPSDSIDKMIPYHTKDTPSSPKDPSAFDKQENITPSEIDKLQSSSELPYKNSQEKVRQDSQKTDRNPITPDQMKDMKVEELRSLARELDITNMTRKQIRFAKKHELIESISKFIEQER